MWCQSPSSLFSHPLTAVMIRRDNAMTSRHASNLQRRGIGPRYARGEGIWGGSAGQQGWTPTNEAIRAYDGLGRCVQVTQKEGRCNPIDRSARHRHKHRALWHSMLQCSSSHRSMS